MYLNAEWVVVFQFSVFKKKFSPLRSFGKPEKFDLGFLTAFQLLKIQQKKDEKRRVSKTKEKMLSKNIVVEHEKTNWTQCQQIFISLLYKQSEATNAFMNNIKTTKSRLRSCIFCNVQWLLEFHQHSKTYFHGIKINIMSLKRIQLSLLSLFSIWTIKVISENYYYRLFLLIIKVTFEF